MIKTALCFSILLSALAAAVPAPQVPGYTDADFPLTVSQPTGAVASDFGSAFQIPVCIPILD